MTTTATVKRSNPADLSVALAGKLAAAIMLLTLVLALLLAGAAHAFAAPLPRAQVLVKDENIRLGDVFDGLSQHADFVLAPAPAPGQDMVWNAPTLMRIATAFNLPWRPQSGDEVHIRRAATSVGAESVRAAINDYMATLSDTDSFNVSQLSPVPDMIVPSLEAPRVELADFSMPPQGGTFAAIVKITGTDGKSQTVPVRGMAERIRRLPTLRHAMKNGDIIAESDIVWIERPAYGLRRDLVADTASLVGTTPRQTIAAGEPVRPEDLQQPLLVSRGDVVTLVYNHNGMMLTAKGRALTDGAKGQLVKVSNLGSNRQIEGRVSDAREVRVE